ncbi:hypothetical protein P4H94_24410 [Paenibacillus macerans]|uniref:Uncharacterized protein n=1 Tax=Paenibacillus macerans TaxID=44252 RepID=A0A090Y6J1_PAEMA|nr:hypothetical protein [Paenibacillus macerans]KFM94378.1 hypothetical protein DJ90_1445 [Paenibacillus macerans]MBS5912916.1 hypothetical protein [Paenibacillus macerans]MCY7558428.1 hypothetical protein [Paenibacillus macerans]MEC0139999.1 hypothetical protein [Paenibacillus macerans]MEC0151917.1 hypothetical protein [Paenibacillus macerans]
MSHQDSKLTIILEKGKQRLIAQTPLLGVHRIVFVVNRQFTNAPNTTQIASGAGRSSAAGSNAAINSPHTRQQQSVGAGGKAKNKELKGEPVSWFHPGYASFGKHAKGRKGRHGKEVVIVINDQIAKLPRGQRTSAATQVASGAGAYSTGGTNSAIGSAGTRQQHAVGGGTGSKAINERIRRGKNGKLGESPKSRLKKR